MPTLGQQGAYRRRHRLVADAPLIEGVYALREGRSLIAEARFHPTADPFLRDHLFHGVPLLPAVIGLEALAEAAAVLDGGRTVVGLRDVQIANGLRFHSGQPQDARIRATLTDRGVECQLCADFYGHHGKLIDPQRVYLKGVVDLADRPTAVPSPPWDPPPGAWSEMQYGDDRQGQDGGLVYHGRAFRCLTHVSLDPDGAWGRILAPPVTEVGGTRASRWSLPAVALDACLVACGVFAQKQLKVHQLPQAFDRLRIARLPRTAEVCTVRVYFRGRKDRNTGFDFTLVGEDGAVIVDAEGHQCIILSER